MYFFPLKIFIWFQSFFSVGKLTKFANFFFFIWSFHSNYIFFATIIIHIFSIFFVKIQILYHELLMKFSFLLIYLEEICFLSAIFMKSTFSLHNILTEFKFLLWSFNEIYFLQLSFDEIDFFMHSFVEICDSLSLLISKICNSLAWLIGKICESFCDQITNITTHFWNFLMNLSLNSFSKFVIFLCNILQNLHFFLTLAKISNFIQRPIEDNHYWFARSLTKYLIFPRQFEEILSFSHTWFTN